jgi:hypothetical protein
LRAAVWHTRDPGSILGRDDLYTFRSRPQRFEHASAEILPYIITLIYLYFIATSSTKITDELTSGEVEIKNEIL